MQGIKHINLCQKNFCKLHLIFLFVSLSLIYRKDNFVTKNIVVDKFYEAGYFALSESHMTVAFLVLFLGSSFSLTVFIAELAYGRLFGHTKNIDL